MKKSTVGLKDKLESFVIHSLFSLSVLATPLTLFVLQGLQLGRIISFGFILMFCYSVYLLTVKKDKKPIIVTNTAFLVFAQIYFFIFRFSSSSSDTVVGGGMEGGIALGLVIMVLTVVLPIFVIFSSISLLEVFERNKAMVLMGGTALISIAMTVYWFLVLAPWAVV